MGAHQPASVFPFVLQLPLICTYVWVILNSHKPFSFTTRIAGSFFLCSAFMLVLPFLATVGGPSANFWACFVAIALLGPCTGINNVSLYSLSAETGPYYMSGFMVGMGLGALILNLLRMWTLQQWPASETASGLQTSSTVFYLISAAFLAVCGISYLTQREKIAKVRAKHSHSHSAETRVAINNNDDNYLSASEGRSFSQLVSEIKTNLRMTQGLLYSLIFVLLITLTVYPGLAFHTTINFMIDVPNSANWTVIGIQLAYNLFDTVGRWMAGMAVFDLSIRQTNIGALLRVLFVLTFVAVALQWKPDVLFGADWFKVANIVLLATTNGHIISLCACKAPETVTDEKERAQVGSYIGFCC